MDKKKGWSNNCCYSSFGEEKTQQPNKQTNRFCNCYIFKLTNLSRELPVIRLQFGEKSSRMELKNNWSNTKKCSFAWRLGRSFSRGRQLANRLPTNGQESAKSRSIDGQKSATVGREMADKKPSIRELSFSSS